MEIQDVDDYEEYFCPVCKCENFIGKKALIDHIIPCQRNNLDIPRIIESPLISLKTEKIVSNTYLKQENVNRNHVMNNQANIKIKLECATDSHLIDIDEVENFYCSKCRQNFQNQNEFNLHNNICNENNYEYLTEKICIISHVTSVNGSVLENRDKENVEPTVILTPRNTRVTEEHPKHFICPLCNVGKVVEYKLQRNFQNHMIKVHNHSKGTFDTSKRMCSFCEIFVYNYEDLLEHYKSCLELSHFKTKTKKVYGIARQNAIKCCMCSCGNAFSAAEYCKHLKEKHGLDKSKRFPKVEHHCIFCNFSFTSYKKLFSHCKSCKRIWL